MTVDDGTLAAASGQAERPDFVMRTDLVTFMAIGAGQLDPMEALLTGRAELEGEVEAAMRCLAIFGFGRTAGAPSAQG